MSEAEKKEFEVQYSSFQPAYNIAVAHPKHICAFLRWRVTLRGQKGPRAACETTALLVLLVGAPAVDGMVMLNVWRRRGAFVGVRRARAPKLETPVVGVCVADTAPGAAMCSSLGQ